MHLTTRKVLALLMEKNEVSGESMAVQLGLSRAAIWKHIAELRSFGYKIDSAAGKGYRLITCPDFPYEAEVHRYFTPKRFGANIVFVEECDSTNTLLKQQAEQGAQEGTVIAANVQAAGRGRRGRTWLAQPGQALLFSVLLRPPLPPRELYGLTLMAGVSVAEALASFGFMARVKWPNDILIEGKKVCGILAEASGELDHTHYVVVGIGINVNGRPAISEYQCTSLAEHGVAPLKAQLLAIVLRSLEENYELYLQQKIPFILDKWRATSATLGQKVRAVTSQGDYLGTAIDINNEGGLIIQLDSGEEIIVTAGDVSLRRG